MSLFGRCFFVVALAVGSVPALAQDSPLNLDAGKSAVQIFNSDCKICHKSPQGLASKVGILGVDSFLREHYTSSKETAAALAAYLRASGEPPAPAVRAGGKPQPKGSGKKADNKSSGKPEEKKAGEEAKPATAKESAKPDEKTPEAKPADKPVDKPAEAKPAEAKPVEAKPVDAKPADAKPADAK